MKIIKPWNFLATRDTVFGKLVWNRKIARQYSGVLIETGIYTCAVFQRRVAQKPVARDNEWGGGGSVSGVTLCSIIKAIVGEIEQAVVSLRRSLTA